MTLRSKVSLWMLCAALGACSGEKKHAVDGGDDVDSGELSEEVDIGDPVDVDGDGDLDGEAVDSDGDGVPDSVDTDGDGYGDVPLPGTDVDLDAGMGASPSDGGGADRVLIGSDSGPLPFPSNDAGQILCGTGPCACSDGMDNDMDGLSDLADPECVSSWDNDEASFATGISGDNRDDSCQDCFFDGNSGSGNDGCYLPSSCISMGNASSGRGRCDSCEQTAQCKTFCKAYTPNGCDCFGCCTVRLANGTNVNVALGNGCNIDGNTVAGCNTCVPNDSCRNECGKCELCPGKTVDDLPEECFQSPPAGDGGTNGGNDGGTSSGNDGGTSSGNDGGSSGSPEGGSQPPPPVYTCEDGAQVCGAGLPACPNGHACDFGCCVLVPIILL